jgi:hypothetical protein
MLNIMHAHMAILCFVAGTITLSGLSIVRQLVRKWTKIPLPAYMHACSSTMEWKHLVTCPLLLSTRSFTVTCFLKETLCWKETVSFSFFLIPVRRYWLDKQPLSYQLDIVQLQNIRIAIAPQEKKKIATDSEQRLSPD